MDKNVLKIVEAFNKNGIRLRNPEKLEEVMLNTSKETHFEKYSESVNNWLWRESFIINSNEKEKKKFIDAFASDGPDKVFIETVFNSFQLNFFTSSGGMLLISLKDYWSQTELRGLKLTLNNDVNFFKKIANDLSLEEQLIKYTFFPKEATEEVLIKVEDKIRGLPNVLNASLGMKQMNADLKKLLKHFYTVQEMKRGLYKVKKNINKTPLEKFLEEQRNG